MRRERHRPGAGAQPQLASTAHATLAKGKPAPAWSGKTVEGKPLSSAQFKGKVVLMNFFGYT